MEAKRNIKTRVRVAKERERRVAIAIFLVFLLLIIVFSAYFIYISPNPSQYELTNPAFRQLKAAIVDQLDLTHPNQTFIQTATNTLEQAGFIVDYYPGEKVSVEFYKNLPTHGYNLIILRTHSSAIELQGREFVDTPVSIFTTESYSKTKHIHEQLTDQLVIASYTMPQPPYYFAIVPKFVTSSMNGRFQNTIIVMMGCEGLNNTRMAEAFVEKGASVYIGWSNSIYAGHTDQATIQLLNHLITEKQTTKQAVSNAMKEVGPDPIENSTLLYYPLEAGDQRIEEP